MSLQRHALRLASLLFVFVWAGMSQAGDGYTLAPLGPDWTSIQDNTPETLLINILDPNRTRKPGYTAYVIETTGGRVVTGIIAASNSSSITLRTAGAVATRT